MAEDARGLAAREAPDPPAPGARPKGSKLASSRPEPYVSYTAAEDGRQARLERVRPAFPTAVATDVLPATASRGGEIMGHAVARRLCQAGG
eukprot:12078653-Alexandrium_andersonii.AAC.1